MNRRTIRSSMAVPLTTLGLCLAQTIQAQVSDGGFELPSIVGPTQFFGPGPMNAWEVSANGLYLVTAPGGTGGSAGWDPAGGLQSLDLNGIASPGSLSQTVSDTKGASYDIDFDLAGDPYVGPAVKTMDVLWNGVIVGKPTFNTTGFGPTNMGWTFEQFLVTGTGSDTLTFTSTTLGAGGPALDDAALVSAVGATPEPNTFVALLAGLTVTGFRRCSRLVRRASTPRT